MDLEERELLPDFQRLDPTETAWILQDHRRIRTLLTEMGIAIHLHLLREASVEEFVSSLRNHASREERSFYRWASEQGVRGPQV
jgi:hypothetical protein